MLISHDQPNPNASTQPTVDAALNQAASNVIVRFHDRWETWHDFVEQAVEVGYIPTFREDLHGQDAKLLNAAFPCWKVRT